MVWVWGLGMGGLLLHVIIDVMRFMAYDKAYSWWNDDTKSNNDTKVARNWNIPALKSEITQDLAADAVAGIVMLLHGENWMWAQFENLSPEDQAMHMEEVEARLAEMEEEAAARRMEDDDEEEDEEDM